jgi:hypothetical protein
MALPSGAYFALLVPRIREILKHDLNASERN